MGTLGIVLVVGGRALDPRNLGWVSKGDPAAHYLGWAFFRDAPWTFPLGASPRYGLEAASGIIYSDALPLLALFLKPLSPLLPRDFQYLGLWIAACFVLQSYLGWRLVALASESPWVRLLGSGLLVFSPPMLWRLHGHEALVGHWIVLAALVLALGPRRRTDPAWWAALGACAALVQAYFLVMVLVLWGADLASRAVHCARDLRCLRRVAGEALLVTGAVLVALWQGGMFLVSGGKGDAGFGYYRMNLLSLFDSQGAWSHVLADLPRKAGDYEGFAFLGLGLLLVVAFAIPAALSLRERGEPLFRREWLFLGLGLLLLTALAASNEVGLGTIGFSYPLPKPLRPYVGIVRSSGRMFWPAFYALALAAIAGLVRAYGSRVATTLLALALVAQIADTRPGWAFFRQDVAQGGRAFSLAPLRSPFWEEAAPRYRKLRGVPFANVRKHYAALGYYAVSHGMATDVVYLARIDPRGWEAADRVGRAPLASGRFDRDTLYVLDDAVVAQAAAHVDRTSDLLANVDGLWVVAPGWLAEGRAPPPDAGDAERAVARVISFGRGQAGAASLGAGWSAPEEWGVWSAARAATLRLPVEGAARRLWFLVRPYLPASAPPLEVRVGVDGVRRATWRFAQGRDAVWREVELADPDPGPRPLAITFSFSSTLSPAAAGESGDTRELALSLVSACVEGAGCPPPPPTPTPP